MKKIFMAIALCLIAVLNFNANAEHITFKGISLGQTATAFVGALKSKGFVLTEKYTKNPTYDIYEMSGPFAGRSNCEVWVTTSKDGKIVGKVKVWLPKETNWYDIKSTYNSFHDSFVQKYGDPTDDYHFFSDPYYEGDGYEMTAVAVDKCNYAAFWSVGVNHISLEISKYKQVQIVYEDDENINILINTKNASVQEDI